MNFENRDGIEEEILQNKPLSELGELKSEIQKEIERLDKAYRNKIEQYRVAKGGAVKTAGSLGDEKQNVQSASSSAPIETDAALTLDAPPMDAPPLDAPPLDAPPLDAPPMDAPPLDALPMDAPSATNVATKRKKYEVVLEVNRLKQFLDEFKEQMDSTPKEKKASKVNLASSDEKTAASVGEYAIKSHELHKEKGLHRSTVVYGSKGAGLLRIFKGKDIDKKDSDDKDIGKDTKDKYNSIPVNVIIEEKNKSLLQKREMERLLKKVESVMTMKKGQSPRAR